MSTSPFLPMLQFVFPLPFIHSHLRRPDGVDRGCLASFLLWAFDRCRHAPVSFPPGWDWRDTHTHTHEYTYFEPMVVWHAIGWAFFILVLIWFKNKCDCVYPLDSFLPFFYFTFIPHTHTIYEHFPLLYALLICLYSTSLMKFKIRIMITSRRNW